MVHNGIIENYAALKKQLMEEGVQFLSETDTEVVAHLIEKNYHGDFLAAVRAAIRRGVRYLTLYAFSTENWKRPKDEVDGIMHLLEQYLHECIDTMEKDGNRLRFLGDLSVLTPELRKLIDETNEISSRIEGFQANVCLNYGGRDEILHAARAFARDCAAGEQDADALTEEGFSRYLYSSGLPDPDLLIRPGGEKRISNYLLWQCAYSEFYFCDTLWPDFTEREFDKALIAYQHRERRFGGLKQEKQK